jgi:hypothetical protein
MVLLYGNFDIPSEQNIFTHDLLVPNRTLEAVSRPDLFTQLGSSAAAENPFLEVPSGSRTTKRAAPRQVDGKHPSR